MSSPSYVITGCAASGTAWAARIMTELGSPCGHQRVFGRFRPRGGCEGESSWMAVGRLPDVPQLLLVRNPLHVVRSLTQKLSRFLSDDDPAVASTEYVRMLHPEIFQAQDHLGRVLRYVATWDQLPLCHEKIEKIGPYRLREIYQHLTGRDITAKLCAVALANVGKQVNSHAGDQSPLTWTDISEHPDGAGVVSKAQRLGYL